MTYNQVQLFQTNDYANHYVDIEITGYRVLYESIAGRGIVRLISWLGTAGPVDCFNKFVILEYIDVLAGYSQLLVGPTLGYAPKARHSSNLQVYLSEPINWNTVNYRNLLHNYLFLLQLIIHFHSRSKPPRSCYQK